MERTLIVGYLDLRCKNLENRNESILVPDAEELVDEASIMSLINVGYTQEGGKTHPAPTKIVPITNVRKVAPEILVSS